MNSLKLIVLLFLSFLPFGKKSTLLSEVDPPNYNFNLKNLNSFQPGEPLEKIEKQFGKGIFLKKKDSFQTYKFYLKHLQYNFPVIVQIHEEKVLDFFAILPSYFLHDVFHQSLISEFGKQDETHKIEGNTLFIWKNKKNVQYIYSATCTITCFPLYFTSIPIQNPSLPAKFIPLLEEMAEGHR